MKCPQHYFTEIQEVILFYNGLDVPTRQILDSRGAVPTKTAEDAKKAIQEMAEYSQKWHNGTSRGRSTETSDGLACIQAQLNNLGRKIKKVNEKVYAAQVRCKQCKGPHYTKDCPHKEEGKTREEAYYTIEDLEAYQAQLKTNPRDQVKSILTTIEADLHSIRRIGSTQYAPLVDLGASISVMPLWIYLHLGLDELAHTRLRVELADRTMKYPKGIAENVLVGIGKFTFPIDFIILDMPEDIKVPLILERPFLSTARAKIDVYKRKITLKVGEEKIIFKSVKPTSSIIKRVYMLSFRERMELDLEARLIGETLVNQEDDLMPTIEEGEVIKKFRTKNEDLDTKIDDYPRALMNVPIFVRTFSIMTDFAILEDMDAYRDEGMGDIIFGEPFLREVGIKTNKFDRIITLYNGDDEVTYQMVRSHPRFKHHTNEQCNKIPPLLKVSERDKKNGISHAYQKLKGFYKGALNLGPDYIQDAKMEEWLTRGHISVHEME
ncbi:putative reverse transcriptase domain-containing protein [Tanacetum coccineum]